MNKLDLVGCEGYKDYNLPSEEEGLINKMLPLEIFKHVLSYLDNRNIQQASFINHFWNATTIDTAKRQEFSKIISFAKFLGENLYQESYASQKEWFFSIAKDTKILNSINLLQVKSSIDGFKENFANIFKDLTNEDLNHLETLAKNETTPKSFENVFDLGRVYKKIDKAKQLTDKGNKSVALLNISRTLTQSGNIDKAIEIANMIPNNREKFFALLDISMALIKSGNIDKAIEVANMIPNNRDKSFALLDISRALTQNGNIDNAIKAANMIPDNMEKFLALRDISKALTQSDNIDKAIEVAKMIPDDRDKSFVLLDISKSLTLSGKTDKAREVANMIPEKVLRSSALQEIKTQNTTKSSPT